MVTDRLLTPLRMTATTFAATEADIPPARSADTRRTAGGRPTGTARRTCPPARSTWTTAADMTLFTWAVLTNQAPGMAALDPEAEADNGQIGLAWQITEFQNREITWHNGGTGGMRSMLALDRERQQGVVVLGNTSRWVNRAGLGLAASDGPPAAVDRPALPGYPA